MNPLSALPVFLRLRGRKAVLAGSGDAAAWKAELLAAAGADALILSPDPSPKLAELTARLGLRAERRVWREADLEGAIIALIEASDEAEAERFRLAARRAGALVNAIDRPAFCDFSFGSIVERSPLVIGISTDGAAPVFAQAMRSRIEAMLPEALREWAKAARAWRERFAHLDLRRRRVIWMAFSARALASRDRGPTEADYHAAFDKAGRCLGLNDTLLAGPTGVFGEHPAPHIKGHRHDAEAFANVLAHAMQAATRAAVVVS